MTIQTADLCDQHEEKVRVADPIGLRNFGGLEAFGGPISTLKAFEDNSLVRTALESPGEGRVLVVDAGGSLRCAMVGDQLALLGVKNGWAGVVVYGCIRDSHEIGQMEIGVMALATHPRKSVKKGIGERDIPVRFAGLTFVPGEYLYADHDGILTSAEALL